MGPKIIEKENLIENLRCLAAQRVLYTEAKSVFFWQIILTTITIVVLSFLDIFYDIEWIVATVSVFITIADVTLLTPLLDSRKEKAAKIQEYFDISVLDIKWNQILVEDKPNKEEIFRYSEKYNKKFSNFDSLKNWYSDKIQQIETDVAKIICQRSNCVYDYSIRDAYSKVIIFILIVTIILLLVIGVIKGLTLRNFFLLVGLPILPVIILLIRLIKSHKTSTENLHKLKQVIDSTWEEVVIKGRKENINDLSREIQNKIFLNRKSSPLIFDWFYEKIRKRLENEMHYSVDQLINEYNNKTQKQ